MIYEDFTGLPEKEQLALASQYVQDAARQQGFRVSEALLSLCAVEMVKVVLIRREVYLAIRPWKSDGVTEEQFIQAFMQKQAAVKKSLTKAEWKQLQRDLRATIPAQRAEDYYMFKMFLLRIREKMPTTSQVIDATLFDACKELLNHDVCRECDLCRFKTREAFSAFLDEKFRVTEKKRDESEKLLREASVRFDVIRSTRLVADQLELVQRYAHRFVDRFVALTVNDCTDTSCLMCRVGLENYYLMKAMGVTNARHN